MYYSTGDQSGNASEESEQYHLIRNRTAREPQAITEKKINCVPSRSEPNTVKKRNKDKNEKK